jgi:MoaA/NifB/PqqE/SkfB family radical SAM enzyme
MSKTFCSLPWIHLATHPHGGVTLCCIADHTNSESRAKNFDENGNPIWLTLGKDSIDNIMNSDYYKQTRLQMLNGEVPKACERCFIEEQNGIRSKRLEENENYKDFTIENAKSITDDSGKIKVPMKFVELRLGNLCNVKCRSCNPASSTKWVKEYKELEKNFDFVTSYRWVDDFSWIENDKFWDDLFDNSDELEMIYINGGEPTLVKKHWEYLDKLVEKDMAKNISLWYSINMTNLPPKTFDVWKKFKNVRISCSIDDIGARNLYLRYPTKWDSVLKNLNLLLGEKYLDVSVCQTISFLNVFYMDEFYDYFHNHRKLHVHQNMVYDPEFLSPWILPLKIKQDIVDRCEKVMDKSDFDIFKSYMMNNKSNEKLLQQGIEYNEYLDTTRKENMRETFKELFEVL